MDPVAPPPVVVVQKKQGMGCFGIGCIVLVVAVLLVGGLIAALSYFAYHKMSAMTSTEPVVTRSFDGGDAVYKTANDKVTAFQQAYQQNQPATLELTADEINTLIARQPDLASNQIHVFVTMTGDRMQAEASIPMDILHLNLLQGHYLNGTADFSPKFDNATKNLTIELHALKVGSEEIPVAQLPLMQSQLGPAVNTQIQRSPDAQQMLNHTKRVEVRDGKLEIETQ